MLDPVERDHVLATSSPGIQHEQEAPVGESEPSVYTVRVLSGSRDSRLSIISRVLEGLALAELFDSENQIFLKKGSYKGGNLIVCVW